MNNFFIVPWLGNSGPEHWQSFFENSATNFQRINQQEWDPPDCSNWIETIDKAIAGYDLTNIILIGLSLGCTAIPHWAKLYNKTIKGAFLVAPSDIENPVYTFPATGFAPIPLNKMNFKTTVVVSENDPWVSIQRAKYFTEKWGSELVNIGDAGHINAASGYGKWNDGL